MIAEDLWRAETFFERGRGLMFRTDWPDRRALWIPQCNSIHMAFVWFPIDAVFLDAARSVVRVCDTVRPWRLAWALGAASVVELHAGAAHACQIHPGDRLLAVPREKELRHEQPHGA